MIPIKDKYNYKNVNFQTLLLLVMLNHKYDLAERRRGWPEGSLFISYNTKV